MLLAVDQSQDAQVAARFLEAVRLPRGAALSIVHATEVPHVAIRFPGQQIMLGNWRKEAATDARRLIDRLVPPLRAQGLRVCPLVRGGLPRSLLLNTVKRMLANLAILGSHGYSRFMRFLLGSVSELLVSEAPASDLIVMGSKGLTGVDRYLLGSVSRRVARHASCSMLVVRQTCR